MLSESSLLSSLFHRLWLLHGFLKHMLSKSL